MYRRERCRVDIIVVDLFEDGGGVDIDVRGIYRYLSGLAFPLNYDMTLLTIFEY